MNKDLHTLEEIFEVEEKFKQGMISLGKSINADDTNNNGGFEKKGVIQNKVVTSSKNKDSHDDTSYQKTFQKLSNEIIELKKLISGTPSMKKFYKPYDNFNKPQQNILTLKPP